MNLLSVYPIPGIEYTHDPNATVATDKAVIFSYEEERLLRTQHAIGQPPERAGLFALRELGFPTEPIDRLIVTSLEACWRKPDYRQRLSFLRKLFMLDESTPATAVPHHVAHTALAVLTSPFADCAFLTLDGGGDGLMGHWGTYVDGKARVVERLPLSIAHVYQFFAQLTGFKLFDEGKVMGLAAYGEIHERLLEWLRAHFWLAAGSAKLETDLPQRWTRAAHLEALDADRFRRHTIERWQLQYGDPSQLTWLVEVPPHDRARTFQAFFEERLEEVVRVVVARTGFTQIACSGGAFLNVAATGVVHRRTGVDLFVPVAPHDAGLSLGSALWVRHRLGLPRIDWPCSPYLGPRYDAAAIEETLREYGLEAGRPADFSGTAAAAIAKGRVIGWFDGRAEYGARALGARSVLADPRDPDAKLRLNLLLKRRDWFMPFAPSILEEHAVDVLEDVVASPYMNIAFLARSAGLEALGPAVHVDGTCRAHIVSRHLQPRYHALIAAFRELTGVPMVLNTSFNRHGLPMVATPRQAIELLLSGAIDALAIEGLYVERPTAILNPLPRPTESDLLRTWPS